MKLLFLVALSLFGAVLCSHHSNAEAEPEPESVPDPECPTTPTKQPLTLEEISAAIHKLRFKVNKLDASIKRMTRIGREQIGKLEVLIFKAGKSNTCLSLDTFGRPAPVQPAPERELAPESGLLSNAQLLGSVRTLKRKVEDLGRTLLRFKEIGKANIGLLNRFVEAARRGVCGESHHSFCPAGFLHHGSSCYQEIVGIKKTWQKAQEVCHYFDSHLVSIESQEENDFVHAMLQLNSPAGFRVWTGLNRRETAEWTWVHSTEEPSFTNWKPCRPAEESHKCAYMCTNSQQWYPANCEDNDKRIVCERNENVRVEYEDEK